MINKGKEEIGMAAAVVNLENNQSKLDHVASQLASYRLITYYNQLLVANLNTEGLDKFNFQRDNARLTYLHVCYLWGRDK